ncbi:DUF3606 domain-containing protein [Pseudomonas oryzihabitans]|uniref:DUF3606 domain-containing protein n=1 Tax=Pseudomonas oryzihabitans TaxID=47885 RepID=UPI00142ECEEB|nr:DUF3606 domain-containing protein [Pseudomonas psychrotolerans]
MKEESSAQANDNKDCLLINIREPSELHFWSKRLGISITALETLVRSTGTRVDDIKKALTQQTPLQGDTQEDRRTGSGRKKSQG